MNVLEAFAHYDENEAKEVYNTAIIEDCRSHHEIENDIERFISSNREKINKRNLMNYCGISNLETENEGCARANSVFAPKFGKSHIKKARIINPYGAISQSHHHEYKNIKEQKKKLLEFSSTHMRRFNVSEFKKP